MELEVCHRIISYKGYLLFMLGLNILLRCGRRWRWWWHWLWWRRWLKLRHNWPTTSINMQGLGTIAEHVCPCLVGHLHILDHAMLILIKIYKLGLQILLHIINAIVSSPKSRLAWRYRSRNYLIILTLNLDNHSIIN